MLLKVNLKIVEKNHWILSIVLFFFFNACQNITEMKSSRNEYTEPLKITKVSWDELTVSQEEFNEVQNSISLAKFNDTILNIKRSNGKSEVWIFRPKSYDGQKIELKTFPQNKGIKEETKSKQTENVESETNIKESNKDLLKLVFSIERKDKVKALMLVKRLKNHGISKVIIDNMKNKIEAFSKEEAR